MHILYDRIRNNYIKNSNYCIKMTGGMSSRTCYVKLNIDFPYVRSRSLRRDTDYYRTVSQVELDFID